MSFHSLSSQQLISDDDDGNISDISFASSSSSGSSEPEPPSRANYQVLEAAEVVALMNNEIAKVKEVVKVRM